MSGNYKQAPELRFTRAKKSGKGPSYFGWEPELWKYINKELSGREGNCIKLINVLLGTAEGFKVSQKWICEMAGLSKDGYYKARKKLEEKGMLIYDEGANTITIDTKGMLKAYSPERENNEGMLEEYPESIHEAYSQGMLEEYPESIHEAYHNKKETKDKQKKETEKEKPFSAGAEKGLGKLSQAKASQELPIIDKEEKERLLKEPMNEGWGKEIDEWFNSKAKVVNPPMDWLGL